MLHPLMDALRKSRSKLSFGTPGHVRGRSFPYAAENSKSIYAQSFAQAHEQFSSCDNAGLSQADALDLMRLAAIFDDSTEVQNLGDLFSREDDSALTQSQLEAAKLYGVKHCFYGATGTTGVNTAALLAITQPDQPVVISRDSHISVFEAITLSGALPYLVASEYEPLLQLPRPMSAPILDKALQQSGAKVAVVTTPSYAGQSTDLSALQQVAHKHNATLMIDQAHGSHFPFLKDLGMPDSATDYDISLVSMSVHKTMSALSQGSVICINDDQIEKRFQRVQGKGFQSTSHSFTILGSVELAIWQLTTEQGQQMWRKAIDNANKIRDKLQAISELEVVFPQQVKGQLDPTRITVNVAKTGIKGFEFVKLLFDLGIMAEMGNLSTFLLIVHPKLEEEDIDRLVVACEKVVAQSKTKQSVSMQSGKQPDEFVNELAVSSRAASFASSTETVRIENSIGRISVESVVVYPPGHGVIIPGMVIQQDVVEYLLYLHKNGAKIRKANNSNFEYIDVLKK